MFKKIRKLLCRCNHSVKLYGGIATLQLGQCRKCQRYWLFSKEVNGALQISERRAAYIKSDIDKLGVIYDDKRHRTNA